MLIPEKKIKGKEPVRLIPKAIHMFLGDFLFFIKFKVDMFKAVMDGHR